MGVSPYRDVVRRRVGDRARVAPRLVDYLANEGPFCAALQWKVLPEPKNWPTAKHPWVGFPWLTPVLGTGALSTSREFVQQVELLPDYVTWRVTDGWPSSHGDRRLIEDESTELRIKSALPRYTSHLVDARLRPLSEEPIEGDFAWTPGKPAPFDGSLPDVACLMMLLAHESTFTYQWLCMVGGRATGLAASPDVEVPTDLIVGRVAGLEAQMRWVVDLLSQIEEMVDPDEGDRDVARRYTAETRKAVGKLLASMRSRLSHKRAAVSMSGRHVDLIADIAWRLVVDGSDSYPGWSDLMLGLVLRDEFNETGRARRRPRAEELRALAANVRDLVRGAVERSWHSSPFVSGEPTADAGREGYHDLFDAVAEMLVAQSDALRASKPTLLPGAVAFSTTFDTELEAGLWRTLQSQDDGRGDPPQFSVVVPAYLVDKNSSTGDFVWLEAIVAVDSQYSEDAALKRVLHPRTWRVMAGFRDGDVPDHPVVVHLAGAPLVELPEPRVLARDLGKAGLSVEEDASFVHSITIDEYFALRHAGADMWSALMRGKGRGLPSDLLVGGGKGGGVPKGPVRFWLALGLAVSDPAVRLRVVSQVVNQRFYRSEGSDHTDDEGDFDVVAPSQYGPDAAPEASRGDGEGDEVVGLAVIRHLDADEAQVLTSLGLDVVTDRCELLAGPLRHYSRHVQEPGMRVDANTGCPLPGHESERLR